MSNFITNVAFASELETINASNRLVGILTMSDIVRAHRKRQLNLAIGSNHTTRERVTVVFEPQSRFEREESIV